MIEHQRSAHGRPLAALALTVALLLSFGCQAEHDPCDGAPGTICTWAGDGVAGFDGDGHAPLASSFYWPVGLTFHTDGTPYIVDWNNHRVRTVVDGKLRTVVGTDFIGDGPEDQSDQDKPGALGTDIHLNHPTQIVSNPDGSMTLVSWHNHKLRRFDPKTGRAWIVCGAGAGFQGDGGPAESALLNQPQAVAWAPGGAMVVMDQRNQVVRRIRPDGVIETVAGTPQEAGDSGDGGPPLAARFNLPTGSNPPPGGWIAVDASGRIYVADTLNHRVRRIDLSAQLVETVAGTGKPGFSGDGGPATQAQLNNPRQIAVGPDGRLWIADELNHRIRAVDLATGTIETVVGAGSPGFGGDGGPAEQALLNRPAGFTFGPDDSLYVLDTYNHRIRRVLGAVGGTP